MPYLPCTVAPQVADQAASVTDAYSELKQPHRRASHLLELIGGPLTEGDNGSLLGPPFLMEIMELREELEGATLTLMQP